MPSHPEGQLLTVKKNSTTIATFVYDGDGRRVKSTMSGTTTVFVGNHYEVSGGTVTYYDYSEQTGNLASKAGLTLEYDDNGHAHAVTTAGSSTYQYDANGNQKKRIINGQTYNLGYDAEGRLVSVSSPNGYSAEYVYDGDGRMVKKMENSELTLYIGNYMEISNPSSQPPQPSPTPSNTPT